MKNLILLIFSIYLFFACSENQSVDGVQNVIEQELIPVDLSRVALNPSPFLDAMEADAKWLLDLESDRLLHRYRKYAGLKPKGEIYGGWESRGLSGHSLGHYITVLSYMYGASGREEFKNRVDYIVDELAECQQANGNGYVGAIPDGDKLWAEIKAGDVRSQGFDLNGAWVPWYNLHKLWAGLIDAYKYTNNEKALDVVVKLSDWAIATLQNLSEEKFQLMLACEHGGMNESFAELYAITGREDFLSMAEKFHHKAILDPLAEQKDDLQGKHANTQIPKIIGAARVFELTGDKEDSTIAAYFLKKVLKDHTYVNGGNSEYEHFGEPGKLADRLSNSTSETCNTYNMLKLAQHVYSWNPERVIGDYMERSLINHILASQHPETGMVTYFVPLETGGQKAFSTPFESFWCCVGTGLENHVKYGSYIYYQSEQGLLIDQFIPSSLALGDWEVDLDSDFPDYNKISILINSVPDDKNTLAIRKPGWVRSVTINYNGSKVDAPSVSEGYLNFANLKAGDRIDISFAMDVYTESMPDNDKMKAVFYGPHLMAGVLTEEKFNDPLDYPVFVTEKGQTSDWIEKSDNLILKTSDVGKPADVEFKPFYQIVDEKYLIYMDIFSEEEWEKYEEDIRIQKELRADVERRTLDILRIGEMQPERDHELKGENTESGQAMGRNWRHAINGWFEFRMKVSPDQNNVLRVTYWGSDAGNREFKILIDNKELATQKLERNKPDQFYDEEYEIPNSFTKGKQSVIVRFQALPDKTAGGVYGVRTMIK